MKTGLSYFKALKAVSTERLFLSFYTHSLLLLKDKKGEIVYGFFSWSVISNLQGRTSFVFHQGGDC